MELSDLQYIEGVNKRNIGEWAAKDFSKQINFFYL